MTERREYKSGVISTLYPETIVGTATSRNRDRREVGIQIGLEVLDVPSDPLSPCRVLKGSRFRLRWGYDEHTWVCVFLLR